jgi:hypothetical protein
MWTLHIGWSKWWSMHTRARTHTHTSARMQHRTRMHTGIMYLLNNCHMQNRNRAICFREFIQIEHCFRHVDVIGMLMLFSPSYSQFKCFNYLILLISFVCELKVQRKYADTSRSDPSIAFLIFTRCAQQGL